MLGKPKYNLGQLVKFKHPDWGELEGVIVVVDKYGVFEDSTDVHYDIDVADEGWYKHIRENMIL